MKKKDHNAKSSQLPEFLQETQTSKPGPWTPPYATKPPVRYRMPHSPQQVPNSMPVSPKSQGPRKEFLKTFSTLTQRWRGWDIWNDFITMVACSISNSVDKLYFEERETVYLQTINKYNKQERELFPKLFAYVVMALEENPEQDFLGDIYTELGLNSKEHRQIFTPYHVCRFMAEITMDDLETQIKENRYVEIHDCCCGAGATLIAAANVAKDKLKKAGLNYQNHVLITGQDIDRIVTMMCYIQLSLLGVAGYFKVGNSLTDPMTDKDGLENYWFTPMYFSTSWHYRRICHSISKLMEGAEDGSS